MLKLNKPKGTPFLLPYCHTRSRTQSCFTVTVLEPRSGADHETYLVEYPAEALAQRKTAVDASSASRANVLAAAAVPAVGAGASTPAGVYAMDGGTFAELHPFHMVLDVHCCVLQFGGVLPRLVPNIAPGVHLKDLFAVGGWVVLELRRVAGLLLMLGRE
jgi:hypothetical protein